MTVAATINQLGVALSDLSTDSRRLPGQCGFLAYPGDNDDGRRYIPAAVRAGAAAVLWEAEGFQWHDDWQVPNQSVAGLRQHAGYFADIVYQKPSMALSVFAITGTNGKTTISHYAAQLCEAAGVSTGVIGTLGAGRLGALSPLANTTPDAVILQKTLRQFADDGLHNAMVEASSHGIEQGRLNGLHLAAAVFSNAGYDHLDYHKTADLYWASKAALFDLPNVGAAILNADDAYCAQLAKTLQTRGNMPVLTYGKKGEALSLQAVCRDTNGVFEITTDGVLGRCVFRLQAGSDYNLSNFLAAALIAHLAGADAAVICECAPALSLPAGRLHRLANSPAVYVDFAHTPDAFAALLPAMRPTNGGRLLLVFGCGGERDTTKRQQMGALAAKYADVVIITDDNPRGEDAATIRTNIQAVAPQALNIADRQQAIATAIKQAEDSDTVLIVGKGHESTQEINGVRRHFSDIDITNALLAGRHNAYDA